jgi:tRNA-dihydrouridine synthase B
MDFKNKLILAPLAGVADSIFRCICRSLGADITWSEMVSADGLVRNHAKSMDVVAFTEQERPYGVQLFGHDPQTMACAARKVLKLKPDFIDLNFGCPVPKVVKRNAGAALMREPKVIGEITSAVVSEVSGLPVTAKIRSGWDAGRLNYMQVAGELFCAGISAIVLHPRTRSQGFTGRSDWSQIARLKETSPVPVIGSGDVYEPRDAVEMFETTGCDAVMFGRGVMGNPWLFARVRAIIDGRPDPGLPTLAERFRLAGLHAEMMAERLGEQHSILQMRKHLGWYTKGLPGASELRRKLFSCSRLSEVEKLLTEYQQEHQCVRTG